MKVCYIKKLENPEEAIDVGTYRVPEFVKKIIFKLKKKFNIIIYKPIDNNYGIVLISNNNEKTMKKVIAKLNNNNIKSVVLSNTIFSFRSLFYSNQIKVLNGKWLFSFLLDDVLKIINDKKDISLLTTTVLVKKIDKQISSNIELIAQSVKHLNVVTEDIRSFEKLENYLYNKYGIMLTVSNNKKKSLYKSDVIINFDFKENDMKRYIIKEDASIINVNERIDKYNKTFRGRVVNDYEINLNKEYVNYFKQYNLYNTFDKNVLYESILITKSNDCFYNIRNKIKIDKIRVSIVK